MLYAPLRLATRSPAIRLPQRRVALVSERVHPLFPLIVWWRRCGKANSEALPPGYEVAAGLRCGKSNTKTPRSFARVDPLLRRDGGGCSIILAIKEEPSRLATLSPLSKRPYGKEPSRVPPIATHPSPAHEDAYRVCRPCSVFMHTKSLACGSVAASGAGRRTDTARLASGDVIASSPIRWTLFR